MINDERKRRIFAQFEEWINRGDIPAPEYRGRWGTLMRWSDDQMAADEDNTCGIRRISEELICLRAVRSLYHGKAAATCWVMFGDGGHLWVYAHDIDWFNGPKDAA